MSNDLIQVDPNQLSQELVELGNTNPELSKKVFSYIQKIRNHDITVLGQNEIFNLRNEKGDITAFQSLVHLSRDAGLVEILGTGSTIVSAQGYEMIANQSGASVIFPKTINIRGEEKPNPYHEEDEKGNLKRVYCVATAFMYSQTGEPKVVNWRTCLDLPIYRLIDLIAKAKKSKAAFRLLPKGMSPDKEKGTWAKYEIDEAIDMFVNTSHDEAISWYKDVMNRVKKATDLAQSFARRNAFKHLFGYQKTPKNCQTNWSIPVICWRSSNESLVKWDDSQYISLQDKVEVIVSGDSNIKGIEYIEGGETVDTDSYSACEDVNPDDSTDMDTAPMSDSGSVNITVKKNDPIEKKAVELTEGQQKQIKQIEAAQQNFPEEIGKALTELKIVGNISDHPEKFTNIWKKFNEIMDEG